MGGFGSGRRAGYGRQTTDGLLALDVRWLQRHGYLLTPGKRSVGWYKNGRKTNCIYVVTQSGQVFLSYQYRRSTMSWQSIEYPVMIEWTACHYGGRRAWFHCPACKQRVAILYGTDLFACRHCHKLTYACQNENDENRQVRRMEKYRERLRWEPGFLNGPSSKPPRMHWRTFNQLRALHDRLQCGVVADLGRRLGVS